MTKHNVDLEMRQIESIRFLLSLVHYDKLAWDVAQNIPLYFFDEKTRAKVLGKGI